jgi:molecular chaperone GrpE
MEGMRKGNGKSDVSNLDLEHELPAAEGGEEPVAAQAAEPAAPSEIEKVKAERDGLLDRLARLQAEFDNARKRAAREQQEFREFAAADVIKSILPILDSLERALKSPVGEAVDFRSGVELIHRQFQDALQKIGVQAIAAVGQPFDPRVHEAIEMVDTTEVSSGFQRQTRLLRGAGRHPYSY